MTSKDLMMELKVIRIKKGISQGKLAEQIGVSRMSVMNWENGATFPSIEILVAICKVLKVNICIKEK